MVNLHSTIMRNDFKSTSRYIEFTFHYGQIYYEYQKTLGMQSKHIYIPLWLDLLFIQDAEGKKEKSDLHSTMVRFIII